MVLISTVVLLMLSFVLHVIWWRVKTPTRQVKSILVLYFSILSIGVVAICTINHVMDTAIYGVYFQMIDVLRMIFLYIASTLAYGISYTAIEAQSPSLEIVRRIHQAGEVGIEPNAIKQSLDNEVLLFPRLSDLQRDMMVRKVHSRYELTQKGRVLETIFRIQRNILLLPRGG